jgi:hypothetical protein
LHAGLACHPNAMTHVSSSIVSGREGSF